MRRPPRAPPGTSSSSAIASPGVVDLAAASRRATGLVGPARQASARYEVFRLRLLGYQRAAAEAGLPAAAVRVWEQPGHSVADGCAAGHALLGLPGR